MIPRGTGSLSSVPIGERVQGTQALETRVRDLKGDCSLLKILRRARYRDAVRLERVKSDSRGGIEAATIMTLISHLPHFSLVCLKQKAR